MFNKFIYILICTLIVLSMFYFGIEGLEKELDNIKQYNQEYIESVSFEDTLN